MRTKYKTRRPATCPEVKIGASFGVRRDKQKRRIKMAGWVEIGRWRVGNLMNHCFLRWEVSKVVALDLLKHWHRRDCFEYQQNERMNTARR